MSKFESKFKLKKNQKYVTHKMAQEVGTYNTKSSKKKDPKGFRMKMKERL